MGSEEMMNTARETFSAMTNVCQAAPKDVWQIEWVGADEKGRGQGHAKRALRTVLERGRETGHRSSQVLCVIGNDPALRLYQSCGFVIEEENRDPAFEKLGIEGLYVLRQK